ncbi:hypothetical protein CXP39_00205 [Mesoplasma syrphidae]|uniref:Uncharacterized protein n=1 Tax=Mesoplasma syrphidae TaxID=225999 RepID=A0A2K9BQE1_9MOLU|nr:hypothetical protein [Mesoplasma syrphidae]AUF83232.1 hypothetical protein CXP39_00205 [Mesoplasma syrphidae]
MKLYLSLLAAVTAGQLPAEFLASNNISNVVKDDTNEITEYEAINRANIAYGTKIKQSIFDENSGTTYWSGTLGTRQALVSSKMKSDFSGSTMRKAIDSRTNTLGWAGNSLREKKKGINMEGQTIFYGNDFNTYYFSEHGITRFHWDDDANTDGLIGSLGGLLGGIVGGLGLVLSGLGSALTPAKPKPVEYSGQEVILYRANQEKITDAIYSINNKSLYYVTENSVENVWRINKSDENGSKNEVIAEGVINKAANGKSLSPKLATDNNSTSKNIFYTISGNIFRVIDKDDIEKIGAIPNSDHVYKFVSEKDGFWVGTSSLFNGENNPAEPKTFFLNNLDKTVIEIKGNGRDSWLRDIIWINDTTKYTVFNHWAEIKSNFSTQSKYTYVQKNASDVVVHNLEGYSGMFDYGLMFQSDESFGTKNRERGMVQRVVSDKFQEVLRFTNLGHEPGDVDYTIDENGRINVYQVGNNNAALIISPNSYITKVQLLKSGTEEEIQGVKLDKNKGWVVPIPKESETNGYDLYIQFFDSENAGFTSVGKITIANIVQTRIDISERKYWIDQDLSLTNSLSDEEILAVLKNKVGQNLAIEKDIKITREKNANYGVSGEILIQAIDTSKLVQGKQNLTIPPLKYDLANLNLGKIAEILKEKSETEIKKNVTEKIQKETNYQGSINDQYEVESLLQPMEKTNGSFTIKAIEDSNLLVGSQKVILPALNAIDLSTLEYEVDKITNESSEDDILFVINNAIKKQYPDAQEIKSEEFKENIEIVRVLPKYGSKGSISIIAKPESTIVKYDYEFKTEWLKFNLALLDETISSNAATKENFLEKIHGIIGLEMVTLDEFNFTLTKASTASEGSITIEANNDTNPNHLFGRKTIVIQKVYDLSDRDLFKDAKFFNETTEDDVLEYLTEVKNWTNIVSSDLEIEIQEKSTIEKRGKIIIRAKNESARVSGAAEQIDLYLEREELGNVINEFDRDLGNFDKTQYDQETTLEEFEKDMLSRLKKKMPKFEIEDITIKLLSDNSAIIIANKDSELYKSHVNISFTIKSEIAKVIIGDSLDLGILEQEPTDEDVQEFLKNYGYTFDWETFEININSDTKKILVSAKNENTLYTGSVELVYVVSKNLKDVITKTHFELSGKPSVEAYLKVLKQNNPELDIDSISISEITKQSSEKNEPYKYSAIVRSTNQSVYRGIQKVTFTSDMKIEKGIRNSNNKVSLGLLWGIAAINILGIIAATLFVRKQKKDKEEK